MQQKNNLDEKLIDNHTGLASPDRKKVVMNKVMTAIEKNKAAREKWNELRKQGRLEFKENVETWIGHMTYSKGAYNSKDRKEETVEIPLPFHRQHYHPDNFVPYGEYFMDQLRSHETHKAMLKKGFTLSSTKSIFKKKGA